MERAGKNYITYWKQTDYKKIEARLPGVDFNTGNPAITYLNIPSPLFCPLFGDFWLAYGTLKLLNALLGVSPSAEAWCG